MRTRWPKRRRSVTHAPSAPGLPPNHHVEGHRPMPESEARDEKGDTATGRAYVRIATCSRPPHVSIFGLPQGTETRRRLPYGHGGLDEARPFCPKFGEARQGRMPLCGNVELRLDPDTRLRRERGVQPTRTPRRPRRSGGKPSRESRNTWGRLKRGTDAKTRPGGNSH